MARPLRIEFPGAVYHITSRGNEQKAIFRDDVDRHMFLNTLEGVILRYNWFCHAYCLMDNHYHLLIDTPDGNLSLGMRQLNGIYTQRFNKRYARVGHLFQGRFKAVLVQKDSHLLEACRYVVLNPVRAKKTQRPEEWTWSSYRATAGHTKSHGCLEIDWVLSQFNPNKQVAETRYRKFVKDGITAESIWKNGRARNILGESDFLESLSDYVKRKKRIPEIPKSERFMNRPSLKDIFRPEVLRDKRKRDKGIGEAVLEYGYTQRVVADHVGMHFASVSRILRTKGRMLKK